MDTFDVDELLTAEDLTLLRDIGAAAEEHDPLPPAMLDRLLLAVSLELMEAELATLADMRLEEARTETTSVETITFTASSLSLMIALSREDDAVRIDGWVTGGGVEVELHAGGSIQTALSDATGRLTWVFVPPGPVRFLIRPGREGALPVLTPIIEV